MAKLATITQLSPTMKEGVLVEWLKKEGDTVKPGDAIAAIETDKAVMELEAFDGGTLLKTLATPGTRLPVGAPIAVIGKPGENFDALIAQTAPANTAGLAQVAASPSAPAPAMPASENEKEISAAKPASKDQRIKASPLARKVAAQRGISLEMITGTGPGGRIVLRDVEASLAQNKAPRKVEAGAQRAFDRRTPLSPMRRTIAQRLSWAKAHVPHFYLSRTVHASKLLALRAETNRALEELQQKSPESAHLPKKLSLNDYILAAAAQSLTHHPEILRQYVSTEEDKTAKEDYLLELGNIDIGFAVSLPDGLITPVLRNADRLGLFGIALEAQKLAERARARKLSPEEYTGAGFTVSNLGMFGITAFQAIINAPEAAILSVGTTERRAYEGEKGEIIFGDFLTLGLACDHRVIDGATGARFLATLAHYLEHPALIR
ncbi:MAG: 2-oxo acid dehydrogenase subunit E2 [Turneriella sp.]|nr:2-oxo acid dehydrogenase subunit E2 [Turneriella sp.]